MDELFTHYQTQLSGDDEFKLFQTFFDSDLRLMREWIKYRFKKPRNVKDEKKSEDLRKVGNDLYGKKLWEKSIEYYTKSLCKAPYDSEVYGLALANRSAVFFTLKDYKSCLKDIELCKQTKYPNKLRSKIYIRQLESYYELGLQNLFDESLEEVTTFIENNEQITSVEKEKCRKKLQSIRKLTPKSIQINADKPSEMPELEGGENPIFLSASSYLRISYDTSKGRHVVAKRKLQRGNVLLVEKAFMFAPVFNDSYEFTPRKCYNCLFDIASCIPCKICSVCLYCDEKCRDASWDESHRWECKGMTVNLWYDLGIAFPALRALFKGTKSGFEILKSSDEEDVKYFGSKFDNYPYFNKLITNIAKMSNVTPLLVSSAVVVVYLQTQTNFFNWLIEQPKVPTKDINDLAKFIGGLLTRHIAQLSCNSSIIQHWNVTSKDAIPGEPIQIACGIYPSVSIMNHSCKPNVTMYFNKDVVIVKALDDISEHEEIFNCYGVDYRYMNRRDRQHALRTLYDFDCRCEICANPSLEFKLLDSYLCPKCRKQIFDCSNGDKCCDCGSRISLAFLQNLEKEAKQYLETDDYKIESINKCYQIRKDILNNNHIDLDECFNLYHLYYLKNGDLNKCMLFFKQSLQLQQTRLGRNSRLIGIKLFDTLSHIVDIMRDMELSEVSKYRDIVEEMEQLFQEAKEIISLYYSFSQVNFNKVEDNIQFIKQLIEFTKSERIKK